MKAFAYVNPANEKEAVAALKTDGIAMLIGGGQDLLARMKDYIDSPDRLVNVKGFDATVTATPDGGLKIGSAVKIVDLAEHAQVGRLYPAVVHAAGEVGTPQIRRFCYGSSCFAEVDARRALPEHPAQGYVRDVRT